MYGKELLSLFILMIMQYARCLGLDLPFTFLRLVFAPMCLLMHDFINFLFRMIDITQIRSKIMEEIALQKLFNETLIHETELVLSSLVCSIYIRARAALQKSGLDFSRMRGLMVWSGLYFKDT